MEVLRAEAARSSPELTRPVKLYPQQLVNVRVSDKDAVMNGEDIKAAIAEAEAYLEGNGRVFVRASGTEPLVRSAYRGSGREALHRGGRYCLGCA